MILRRLAPILLASVLAACSTIDNLNPFVGKPGPKPVELAPIPAALSVRTLWQASVGKSEEFALMPAVIGNSVVAAGRDGTVARFEGGRQVWRISIGQTISGGVGGDEQMLVVGTVKGEVVALAPADGKELWRARVSAEVLAPPATGAGLVVVRSGDNRLFGFDAADGKRKWVYQRANPALSVRGMAPPILAEGLVFAGFPGGKLVAVSAQNGAIVWEGTVALPKGATELDRVADVVAPPVLSQKTACAVAFQGRLACFDLGKGNLLWARDVSSSVGLAMDSRYVFVTDDKGVVQAFDRANGGSIWKQDKLQHRDVTAPVVRLGLVVVADGKGVVHFLSGDDGRFVARGSTDSSGVVAPPQVMGGTVMLQTKGGGLFALDTE